MVDGGGITSDDLLCTAEELRQRGDAFKLTLLGLSPDEGTPPPPPPRSTVLVVVVAAVVLAAVIGTTIALTTGNATRTATNIGGSGFAAPTPASPFTSRPPTVLSTIAGENVGLVNEAPVLHDVGDSITAMSRWAIRQELGSYRVLFAAHGGVQMAEQEPVIARWAAQGFSEWVIELGTNDAWHGNPNALSDFSTEVSVLQDQKCVVLVTVNPTINQIAVQLDEAIASTASQWPNFRVLDWGTIEHHNPAWLLPDGIHPSTSGQRELARLEGTALAGCA